MAKEIAVIKIGGKAAYEAGPLKALIREMSKLKERYHFIMIHGGGNEVSRISELFGMKPVFKDGVFDGASLE